MSFERGTSPGRHPWFLVEGREQTQAEAEAMFDANRTLPGPPLEPIADEQSRELLRETVEGALRDATQM